MTFDAGDVVGCWRVIEPMHEDDKPMRRHGAYWIAMCERCKDQAAVRARDLAAAAKGRRAWVCAECGAS